MTIQTRGETSIGETLGRYVEGIRTPSPSF